MKKRTDLPDIRTIDDLDAALHRTREQIRSQGETVHENLLQVRDYYTPRNLAFMGLKRFAWEHNLFVIGLDAVRRLKKLLEK